MNIDEDISRRLEVTGRLGILLSRALSRELDEINYRSLSSCRLVTRERRRY